MHLKNLSLFNFRNYSALDLKLDDKPTILVGDNAAGKSNLLEAVYFLSTTKSGRVDEERELIKQGQEVARLQGIVDSEQLEITLQNTQDQFSKRVKVNGIPRRVVDYIGNLPAVIFYPWDINMVTGAPALRRWHLDIALAQVDPHYKKALTQYEQVLVNRNRILKRIKEGQGRADELDYWTKELVEKGQEISVKRKDFFEFINRLDKFLGEFVFEYIPSQISMEKLQETNGREVAAAATLIGPHRDDYVVKMDKRMLAHYGSRGEQRLATLAFKLATLEYMALSLGKRPILLLDDVFSELDESHRQAVVEVVSRQQTILSAVELHNLPKDFLKTARILKVEEGKIIDTPYPLKK